MNSVHNSENIIDYSSKWLTLNLCVSIVDKGSAHEWLPSEFQIEIYRGKFKTRISKEHHLIMHVKGQSTKQVHELCVFVNLNVK